MDEPSDADVVVASVARPDLFEAIFSRHHGRIWAYLARSAGRERADELAGEVFVQAFAHRGRYDPDRGTVVGWLYGIAANLAKNRFRERARASRALARVAGRAVLGAAPIDDAVAALDGESTLARVEAAMAALPAADRELIVLVAWERLTYAEVADVLGLELGTVRSRLSRARHRLRELAALDEAATVGDRDTRKVV